MDKLLGNLHIALIALVLYFGWLSFSEFSEQLEQKQMEAEGLSISLSAQKEKLGEIEVYKNNLERSRQKLKEVREQILLVQEKLPSEKDQTGLLDFLSDQADRLKLDETSFKPLEEINRELYFIERYEVQGVGTFQQFLVYLEKMSEQTRVYNIDFMEMRPVASEDDLEATKRSRKFQILETRIVIETYRFNKAFFDKTSREMNAAAAGGSK